VAKRQVRVECEALAVDAPLEFFICSAGRPSTRRSCGPGPSRRTSTPALLAVGLKPGRPMTFAEAAKKWLPPQGPPLHLTVEYERGGKPVSYPAYRWLRDIRTKKEARAFTWIFAGSRLTEDGRYGADDTGYVATLVNFDYAMIDIPDLASNSNDLLEWERNAELMPAKGAKVTLVIEPAGGAGGAGGPGGAGTVVARVRVAARVRPNSRRRPAARPPPPDLRPRPAAPPRAARRGCRRSSLDEQKLKSMVDTTPR
jgi:hypothetical protein